MRKVVSVRLREDLVKEIDEKYKGLGFESRTDFIKEAIKFYLNRKMK